LSDQGTVYESLLTEQEDSVNSIPLHLSRLQQLENQFKQRVDSLTNEEKDEKLNEIIRFIQEKLLPLIDEEAIFKFFGQKNAQSNDKDILQTKTFVDFSLYLSVSQQILV